MLGDEETFLRVGNYGFVFQRGRNDLALFVSLGGALTEVQSFEMLVEGYVKDLTLDASSEDTMQTENPERFFSQSLGILIKNFQKHLPDKDIAPLLERARDRRNYLVHKILRQYGWPLMSDDDYVRAIQEIEGIRELIQDTGVEISRYLKDRSLANLVVLSIDHKTGEVKQII